MENEKQKFLMKVYISLKGVGIYCALFPQLYKTTKFKIPEISHTFYKNLKIEKERPIKVGR